MPAGSVNRPLGTGVGHVGRARDRWESLRQPLIAGDLMVIVWMEQVRRPSRRAWDEARFPIARTTLRLAGLYA